MDRPIHISWNVDIVWTVGFISCWCLGGSRTERRRRWSKSYMLVHSMYAILQPKPKHQKHMPKKHPEHRAQNGVPKSASQILLRWQIWSQGSSKLWTAVPTVMDRIWLLGILEILEFCPTQVRIYRKSNWMEIYNHWDLGHLPRLKARRRESNRNTFGLNICSRGNNGNLPRWNHWVAEKIWGLPRQPFCITVSMVAICAGSKFWNGQVPRPPTPTIHSNSMSPNSLTPTHPKIQSIPSHPTVTECWSLKSVHRSTGLPICFFMLLHVLTEDQSVHVWVLAWSCCLSVTSQCHISSI